jgi:hypothetical protein
MLQLVVPSHVLERAHINAYPVLKVPHTTGDCMMATARREWDLFLPCILDHLYYIALTPGLDDDEVCRTLVLREAQIGFVIIRLVFVGRQVYSCLV